MQQLIFQDTKLWGLSKINFKLNLLLRMNKLVVSNRIHNFEDKFFRGSVNIHKNPQNLLCWKVSHLTLYNRGIDIAQQQECKSCWCHQIDCCWQLIKGSLYSGTSIHYSNHAHHTSSIVAQSIKMCAITSQQLDMIKHNMLKVHFICH